MRLRRCCSWYSSASWVLDWRAATSCSSSERLWTGSSACTETLLSAGW